jgi:protein-S-isoprenylcysteine O-methyltransferase Ste14
VLLIKSLLFAILLPGTVTLFVPYLMLSGRDATPEWDSLSVLAFIPLTAGAIILLRCIWDFAVSGRGTLAPIDPPKELVVHGLYRYVRNPMYVGVLLVLLGEAWLFNSRALLVYAGGFWGVASAFVFFYEEPTLRRKFGGSYARYYRSVNRWLPRKRSGSSL